MYWSTAKLNFIKYWRLTIEITVVKQRIVIVNVFLMYRIKNVSFNCIFVLNSSSCRASYWFASEATVIKSTVVPVYLGDLDLASRCKFFKTFPSKLPISLKHVAMTFGCKSCSVWSFILMNQQASNIPMYVYQGTPLLLFGLQVFRRTGPARQVDWLVLCDVVCRLKVAERISTLEIPLLIISMSNNLVLFY